MREFVERLRPAIACGALSLLVTARQRPQSLLTPGFAPLTGLTPADSAALLQTRGVALEPRQLEALHALSEGNPEVLLLASGLLRQNDPDDLIARLATTPDIVEFLMNEVYDALDGEPDAHDIMGRPGYPRQRARHARCA